MDLIEVSSDLCRRYLTILGHLGNNNKLSHLFFLSFTLFVMWVRLWVSTFTLDFAVSWNLIYSQVVTSLNGQGMLAWFVSDRLRSTNPENWELIDSFWVDQTGFNYLSFSAQTSFCSKSGNSYPEISSTSTRSIWPRKV